MDHQEVDKWLQEKLPVFDSMTTTVVAITKNLLDASEIEYLAVTGRTKSIESTKEKIQRKAYKNPIKQLTDISGIRIIVYFESDIEKVCQIIENGFHVDKTNSLDKKSLLASDQLGYRSVHFVCDLGRQRCKLPEFSTMNGLKFEFQVRTVLQHAWAELAHDRNYKFTGKLPKEIERKLFLFAGMLEIADQGFDEVSKQIDCYVTDVNSLTEKGLLDIPLDSISLVSFVKKWATENKFNLDDSDNKRDLSPLIGELERFGISKINQIEKIIPTDYAKVASSHKYGSGIFGLLRDWMILDNYKRYKNQSWGNWRGLDGAVPIYKEIVGESLTQKIISLFGNENDTL